MSDLLDHYLACWNATDAGERWHLLQQHWADDCRYVDPLADVQGRAAVDATIAAVQEQFPGFVFTPAGPVDAHHDVARFQWGLGPAGADPVVIGFDVVTTDADGRIRTVTGFLDRIPG